MYFYVHIFDYETSCWYQIEKGKNHLGENLEYVIEDLLNKQNVTFKITDKNPLVYVKQISELVGDYFGYMFDLI